MTAAGVQDHSLFDHSPKLYSEKGLNKLQLQRLDELKKAKILWLITLE